MPRTCTVCSQKWRRRIDAAIASGQSNRTIATQFRLSPTAVQSHKQHACAAIERAAERRELTIGESVLAGLESLYSRGLNLLSSAEQKQNYFACVALLRELRGILGALYEAKAEVHPEPTTTCLPEEYKNAISRALGFTGVLVPLRAEEITGERQLSSANDGDRRAAPVDLDVLPP